MDRPVERVQDHRTAAAYLDLLQARDDLGRAVVESDAHVG
jgi:hypothetical protein